MINFALAREIYGMTPWFVDQQTLPALMGVFNSFQNGVSLEIPDVKYNTPSILSVDNETRVISRPFGDAWSRGQLENTDDFTGVGLINIDGAITVGGGASSHGMRDISSMMFEMAKDERIKSFIVHSDSGGGSSGAVEIMTDTINQIKQSKPVYGLIKKGGVAASAMYGILSATNAIYAESPMSIVGSVGTMIQFEGKKANSEDRDGFKFIRLYATKSKSKNKGFEDALNKDDYTVIMDEMLNPINERFISMVLANRPSLAGSDFDDGHTVFAKDAIGTFIDGIMSFDELVNVAVSGDPLINANGSFSSAAQTNNKQKAQVPNNNSNLKNQKMDLNQLKSEHPSVYNEVFALGSVSGVKNEKDRVGSWMAHSKTDIDAVKNGIESGEPISATKREEFLVKNASLSHLENLKSDSAKALKTTSTKTEIEPTEDEKELTAFEAKLDEKLNLKTV